MGAERRAARGADGQLRGRPPQPRGRARSSRRTSRASTPRSRTARWPRTRCCRRRCSDAPRVHLIGLVSDGGVHSSDRHLKALIELAAEWGIEDLVVHAFTDGRDTSPKGGAKYLAEVQAWMEQVGAGRIGSVVGRYFAMDRDKRWDRVQKAYDLLVHGKAEHHADTGAEAAAGRLRARRDGRVHRADDGRRGGEDPPRRRRDRVQLPPGPDARDHARAVRPGLRRDRPRRRRRRRALHDARRVRRGLGLSRRLPAQAPGADDRRGHRARGQGPAARRGDREVPARDVLLQRRRGEARTRARCASSCRPRATSRPTTTSPR